MNWYDVWKLPLKLDEYGESYVFDSQGQMALMFYDEDDKGITSLGSKTRKKIVDVINGEINDTPMLFQHTGGEILDSSGDYIFCIRGWGHLTGVLKLNSSQAARIQDDFGNYIVYKLNGTNKQGN